jgi:type 1 glutamine amidotransferase
VSHREKDIMMIRNTGTRTWAAVVAAAAVASVTLIAQTNTPGGPLNQNLGSRDYGVCRGLDPACYHNWGVRPAANYKALLFTRTASLRHANLGPALGPGLNPPLAADNLVHAGMRRLAEASGFALDYTEDPAAFTRLNQYHAIIFFSTNRDALDDAGQTALRQYIRTGGGFVAVHNAFGTEYNWPYYEGLLGNANFYDHGPYQPGEVVVINTTDESTRGLPARFPFRDEWYNLVPFPTDVRFLATVDAKTLKGGTSKGAAHPGHGDFHPVTWCQYYDGGRAWLTTLGHAPELFDADNSRLPGALEFQQMLAGGIRSVMGIVPFCQ